MDTVQDLVTCIQVLHKLSNVEACRHAIPHVADELRHEGKISPFLSLREMPYSEVCTHMKVAGKLMWTERLIANGNMIQLHHLNGEKFSMPITAGEAGMHQERLRYA